MHDGRTIEGSDIMILKSDVVVRGSDPVHLDFGCREATVWADTNSVVVCLSQMGSVTEPDGDRLVILLPRGQHDTWRLRQVGQLHHPTRYLR